MFQYYDPKTMVTHKNGTCFVICFDIASCDCGAEILAPNSLKLACNNKGIPVRTDGSIVPDMLPKALPINECWPNDTGNYYCNECEH